MKDTQDKLEVAFNLSMAIIRRQSIHLNETLDDIRINTVLINFNLLLSDLVSDQISLMARIEIMFGGRLSLRVAPSRVLLEILTDVMIRKPQFVHGTFRIFGCLFE